MISTERWLWLSFTLFFGLIVVSTFLPTRPVVGVFPTWSLVVLAAAVGTFAVAIVAAFGRRWPAGGEEA